MLEGEQGHQRKEVAKLVEWLERDVRPDVVHLNNAMLMGVVREITRRLGVPVVCSLSGEDAFLEKLPEPHRSRARERAAGARGRSGGPGGDESLLRRLAWRSTWRCRAERIRVIPPGLNLAGHGTRQSGPRPFTIGYLARVCPDKGLHQLAAALRLLAADARSAAGARAGGRISRCGRRAVSGRHSAASGRGRSGRSVRVSRRTDRAAKIAFLQSLDLFCLPTVYRESKGLSVLEAWANAVPAVLPAHGAFPEMIEDTGGGLLCEPNDPAALAAALKRMVLDARFGRPVRPEGSTGCPRTV